MSNMNEKRFVDLDNLSLFHQSVVASEITDNNKSSVVSAPSIAGAVSYVESKISTKQDTLSSGNGIDLNSNQVSVKYDDSTIKLDSNGNLKAAITTYQPFPSDFVTSGTLKQVVDSMISSSGAKEGMAYLGGIRGECTPFGYGNVECKVEYMTNSICVLTVNSSNIIPYQWVYNSYSRDYMWKKYTDVIPNPSGTTSNLLSKVSLDGTMYNVGGVINQSLTSSVSIGGISEGDTFPAGTSIETILRKLLGNN